MMTYRCSSWCWKLGVVSALAVGGAIAWSNDCAKAQITPDNTLGAESSVVTPNVDINGLPSDRLDGGAVRGANLFHSFQQFNVSEGRGAYFTNPAGIENILSRVTGNDPSDILGTLGVLGNANLFLLNPNGIIFGPNARLDVGGSFVATTANAIQFADHRFFSASAPNIPFPALTVSPSAFLFNQIAAQSITNQSEAGLQVPTGESFLLLGGDVSLDGGSLLAPGGRVELGAVAGSGTVGLNIDGKNLSLSFPDGVERADISLTNAADVNVRAGGGGSIAVNAKDLSLAGGSRLRTGIALGLGSVDSKAGDIEINATGAINLTNFSFISNSVRPKAVGNSGNINITTGSFYLSNDAFLATTTEGQGDAGEVTVTAHDTISVTNGAFLASNTFKRGNAGKVTITARNTVSFNGVGRSGQEAGVFSNVEPNAVGKGADITVTSGSLSLTNGAGLFANTFGQGNAGNVTIQASGAISFDGAASNGVATGVYSNVGPTGVGKGGEINITAGSLSLTNGAELAASTLGLGYAGNVFVQANDSVSLANSSNIFNNVVSGAVGNGGEINIKAESLSLTDGAQLIVSTSGWGDAGSVSINAHDTVSFDGVGSNDLSSGAFSDVQATGVGNGGNINIKTGALFLTNSGALVASTSGQGDAGDVTIAARDTVSFDGVSSNGSSSVAFSTVEATGVGNGGDINITTGSLSLTNGAQVAASTLGQGDAGNLTINARDTVSFDGVSSNGFSSGALTTVEATGVGNGGDINITTGSLIGNNGGLITASSEGSGAAGNIEIAADSIRLDNQALLSSDTTGGQGNIFLRSRDLVLRRGSNITTNATGTASGGNITIDTGVIAALEDSDISANAPEGFGGRVIIDAQGIFGTEFRNQPTPESDITASSNLGPKFSGTVEINTPDVDLQNSLSQLSANFVSPDQVVAGSCLARRNVERGSFTVTGTGGLPRSPYEAMSGRYTVTGVQPIQGSSTVSSRAAVVETAPWKRGEPLQEAQGMAVTADGRTIVGTNPQLVALAKAQNLVCHSN